MNSVLASPNWFKIKNSSYTNAATGDTTVAIPPAPISFDSDDNGAKQLLIGESGVILTDQPLNLVGSTNYSQNNWIYQQYPNTKSYTSAADFVDSISQKTDDFATISSLNEIVSSDKKIFLYNSDLTIDDSAKVLLDSKNLVLVVTGTIDFKLSDSNFNPTHSLVIMATHIKFYDKNTPTNPNTNWSGLVTTARGIYVADTIDLGTSADKGFKVVGNMISLSSPVINTRQQADNSQPSIFVVFDPKIYIETLGLFGSKTYNWIE